MNCGPLRRVEPQRPAATLGGERRQKIFWELRSGRAADLLLIGRGCTGADVFSAFGGLIDALALCNVRKSGPKAAEEEKGERKRPTNLFVGPSASLQPDCARVWKRRKVRWRAASARLGARFSIGEAGRRGQPIERT